MEDIAPPLRFVLSLRMGIDNGHSIQTSIRHFIEEFPTNSFTLLLELWMAESKTENRSKFLSSVHWTPWRQIVLDLVDLGLQGHSILEDLDALEKDLTLACENQIARELQKLPFVALIPVLMLQFPAYLLLLLGPWLSELIEQLV